LATTVVAFVTPGAAFFALIASPHPRMPHQ
jgi:hypothetical protein